MFLKQKRKRGFTIVEVLVVIAVITVTSAIMIVNFRKGGESGRLQRSAQQIVQTIRRAQNMAMSSVEFGGNVPIEGYGVRFRTAAPTSYILFADTLNDSSCGYPGTGLVETLNLENGIEIDSLYTYTTAPGIGLVSRPVVSSCFIPPDPQTSVSPGGANVGGIIVNIRKVGANCVSSPSNCRNIVVGKAGGTVSIGIGAIKL